MTNKIQEKKELFINKKAEYEKMLEDDNKLSERLNAAEENIVNLQEEMEELKQKRPAMLADNQDITALNKRLKTIEEEIEINKDTITGITAKRKSMHNPILSLRQDVNSEFLAFTSYKFLSLSNPNNSLNSIGSKFSFISKIC